MGEIGLGGGDGEQMEEGKEGGKGRGEAQPPSLRVRPQDYLPLFFLFFFLTQNKDG